MCKRIVSSYGTRLGTEKGAGMYEVRESWKSKANTTVDLNSVAFRSVALESMCASGRATCGLASGVKMVMGLHRLAMVTLGLSLFSPSVSTLKPPRRVWLSRRVRYNWKLTYADVRSVTYLALEGWSPAGAADNIADKCLL